MKTFLLLSALTTLILSSSDCKKKATGSTYKAKLEIAGICMNYTIGILDGDIDTSLITATWRDEMSEKIYTNVFRLDSPCTFPDSIKQGDEFYFTIDTLPKEPCMVCQAYYPTPSKALSIKVVAP